MSLPVAYGALLAGVIVWLLLVRKLSARPWEPQPAFAADRVRLPPARVGLWLFMAVVTSLFALFISAYYMRMGGHGHGAVVHDWHALAEPAVLWLNTGLLLWSSVAMHAARRAAATGQLERAKTTAALGGLLALLFLAGQLYAWRHIRLSEQFTPHNPAVAFFYLLTAVHGLHLLGGLYVWGRTQLRLRRARIEPSDVSLSVELCSVYWHYLLLVWLALFAVLLST